MKSALLLLFSIAAFNICFAQSVVHKKHPVKKAHASGQQQVKAPIPFIIIKTSGDKWHCDTIAYTDDLFEHINPSWIDSITVLKPSKGIHKVASPANNGAVIVTLNDKLYPNAFTIIEKYMKKDTLASK